MTAEQLSPPVMLGDATAFFRITGRTPAGGEFEEYSLGWTHGSLLLVVETEGLPGTFSVDDLVAFARRVEVVYQRSAFAGVAVIAGDGESGKTESASALARAGVAHLWAILGR